MTAPFPPAASLAPDSTLSAVASGGARLAVETAGGGRPIVFLHAAIADRRMWGHAFATLARTHRVIAYDRRGFGETPAVDEAFSQTDDLFAVIDGSAGQRAPAILVACSQGCAIAIDAALAAPERVSVLVLIAPSVSGAPLVPPSEPVRRLNAAIDAAQRAGDLDAVNRLKAALFLDGAEAPEGRVRGPTRALFLDMNGIALANAGIGRLRQPEPAWDRLGEVAIPVRILCGALDIPHILTRARAMAERLPDATVEIIPDTAHLPSLEAPERVTARLLEILADIGPI